MLAGPTFFQEAILHDNLDIVFPIIDCGCRPYNFKNGIINCGCMNYINIEDILKLLK